MIYYIADTHFGHGNVIKFDDRPFDNVENMDEQMMALWNETVGADDDIYIVGDFCYRNGNTADWYLKRLSGRKHLIVGNHDGKTLKNPVAARFFESVEQIGDINDNGRRVILCHYPMAEWNGMRRGSFHVYGHIHGNRDETFEMMRKRERALNAGACIINYMPATLDELITYNRIFREAES